MRPSIAKRMWTQPDLPMAPAFHRMSYALFRTDGDVGRVVAARTPHREMLSVGHRIQDSLAFCPDALAHMTNTYGGGAPLFILTRAGIGLLSSRYRLGAGLGLYLHIHTGPASAARLINSGALGDPMNVDFSVSEEILALGDKATFRDEDSYPALLEAWEAVRRGSDGVFSVDASGNLPLRRLRDGIASLAEFAGCGLTFTLPKEAASRDDLRFARVKCYRPGVLEALLLCLLSEVRDRSATRCGTCCLDPYPHGGEGLTLTLRYPLYPHETPESAEMYDTVHSYLTGVGETWGLDLYPSPRLLPPREPHGLPEVAVNLDWLLDPSALSTSDIKSCLTLARAEESREEYLNPEGEILWDDAF